MWLYVLMNKKSYACANRNYNNQFEIKTVLRRLAKNKDEIEMIY